MNIAQTIIHQIQVQDKWALLAWGANEFVALNNGVQFKIKTPKYKKGVRVKIVLNSLDTYDISVFCITGVDMKVLETSEGIYNDMLIESLDGLIDEKEIIFV